MKQLLTLALLFCTLSAHLQDPFTIRLGDERQVIAQDLLVQENGAILLTGSIRKKEAKEVSGIEDAKLGELLNGLREGDLFLMKMTQKGKFDWVKSYGDPRSLDMGLDVIRSPGGGYLLVGYTLRYQVSGLFFRKEEAKRSEELFRRLSLEAPGIRSYLVKTGKEGDLEWTQTFGEGNLPLMGYRAKAQGNGKYRIEVATLPKKNARFFNAKRLTKVTAADLNTGMAFLIDDEGELLDRTWTPPFFRTQEEQRVSKGRKVGFSFSDGTRIGIGSMEMEHDRFIYSWSTSSSKETPEINILKEVRGADIPRFEILPMDEERIFFRKLPEGPSRNEDVTEFLGVLDKTGESAWTKSYRPKEKRQGGVQRLKVNDFRTTASGEVLFFGQVSFSSAEKLKGKNGFITFLGPDGEIRSSKALGTRKDERIADLHHGPDATHLLFQTVGSRRDPVSGSMVQRLDGEGKSNHYQKRIEWEEARMQTPQQQFERMSEKERKKARREMKKLEKAIAKEEQKAIEGPFQDLSKRLKSNARFSNVLQLCKD